MRSATFATFVLLIVVLVSHRTGHAFTESPVWETRFNHALGIEFALPVGYEIIPEYLHQYTNGHDVVRLWWMDEGLQAAFVPADRCAAFPWPHRAAELLTPNVCQLQTRDGGVYTIALSEQAHLSARGVTFTAVVVGASDTVREQIASSIRIPSSVDPALYLDESLRLLRSNYVYRAQVDWEAIEAQAWATFGGTLADAHRALEGAFALLNAAEVGAHRGRLLLPPGAQPRMQSGAGASTSYPANVPPIGRRLSGNIGYLETFTLDTSAPTEVASYYATTAHNLIREIDGEGVCGWIIDVRRNGGGQIAGMAAALGPLIGNGVYFTDRLADGRMSQGEYQGGMWRLSVEGQPGAGQALVEQPYTARRSDTPIALLVSEDTLSMGEMTVFLFQQRRTTRVFGETTGGLLGDGIIDLPLADRATLRVVDRVLLDPQGQPAPRAIVPDVAMQTDSSRYGTDDDPLVQAATAWLRTQGGCQA
jgi:carboxyl-terminal processing protease